MMTDDDRRPRKRTAGIAGIPSAVRLKLVPLLLQRRRREARRLDDIVERFGRLPVLDEREPDDIIGYDAHGLPS